MGRLEAQLAHVGQVDEKRDQKGDGNDEEALVEL